MSAHAWALRPDGLVSPRGRGRHGALHTLLQVLLDVCEIVAFSYRLRTAGSAARGNRSAAR